jgi:hypothetical protein
LIEFLVFFRAFARNLSELLVKIRYVIEAAVVANFRHHYFVILQQVSAMVKLL